MINNYKIAQKAESNLKSISIVIVRQYAIATEMQDENG